MKPILNPNPMYKQMKDIKAGEVFSFEEELFMKTDTPNDSYAVSLVTAKLRMFFWETLITYPTGNKIVLTQKLQNEIVNDVTLLNQN